MYNKYKVIYIYCVIDSQEKLGNYNTLLKKKADLEKELMFKKTTANVYEVS